MSTPIETNTEELQEVLQQVYNLPSRSGGSTAPDLIISFVANEGGNYLTSDSVVASNFSIKSGSVESAFSKLLNHKEVKVILEHEYWYAETKYTGIFYPVLASASEDGYGSEQYLSLEFVVNLVPGSNGYTRFLNLSFYFNGTVRSAELLDQ